MMARFFASDHANALLQDLLPENFTALELGSGNGLLAVCLAALTKDRMKHLVVTDMEDHLELIAKTLAANSSVLSKIDVHVVEHRWGDFEMLSDDLSLSANVRQGQCKFDLIIGSDVAYHPRLYDSLIASFQAYFHENTAAFIGFTMMDTTIEFFDKLKRAGFEYERIPEAFIEPKEFRGTTFGIFCIRCLKPRIIIRYNKSVTGS